MKKILFILLMLGFLIPKEMMSQNAIVLIKTNLGDMKVRLYNGTPLHRDNFIKLAEEGFYDSLLFHRVIKGFMIQAGDPESKKAPKGKRLGSGGPGYEIPAEINIKYYHKKGALAAARKPDQINREKKSSGSQFYIVQGQTVQPQNLGRLQDQTGFFYSEPQFNDYANIGGTPHLDGGYTVFGEVIEGLEIIDKISVSQTDSNDRPVNDVIILKVEVLQKIK